MDIIGKTEEESMTEFYVVRHGETAANNRNIVQGQSDIPLNETGLAQAARLAERLQTVSFDAVYSSDLDRAMRTARIIAPGLEPIPSPALREWDLGDWVGRPFDEVKRLYPDEVDGFLHDREELQITGGESKREAYGRIDRLLDELAEKESGKRLLLVTHCGVIRAMLKHVLGGPASLPRQPQVGNASFSRLLHANGCWQLGSWNDTSHLDGLVSRAGGY
jgi:broad specificity phosphatase PhoE